MSGSPERVLLAGATGTIGRATARALVERGHSVTCFVRPGSSHRLGGLEGATVRVGDVADAKSLAAGFAGERYDAVVSCIASRTGAPADAWAIDHDAQMRLLEAATSAGVPHFVLLSAICVQKPLLAFQHAKLAFEAALMTSGLDWTIVRPTAFFKSLSGQVERVKGGRKWLLFGDGELTACKPISDGDLARFLVRCVEEPVLRNRILPVGGPGPAITPRQQAEALFAMLGQQPRYRHVPVAMMDAIVALLSALGRVSPRLRDKAELARIGRYYATESMLVLDPETGRYDAAATPETGSETLFDHYRRLLRGEATADLGDHALL